MPFTTTPPPRTGQNGVHAVSPYVTLSIIIGGVAGGLFIVIVFVLFCKYCVKKDKSLQRTSTAEIRRQSDRDLRRFKPLQRYETINSDVFSEPSTGSMEGLPISPRKCYDSRSLEKYTEVEEVTETTKLKTDFEKASYKETAEDNQDNGHGSKVDDDQDNEKVGRRVSFHLENLPPATSTYLRQGRRYTDGDFHHLKRSRIEKVVPRQYSLCAPSHSSGGQNSPLSDHRPPLFMEEDLDRHGGMVTYRPPLIALAESPSPPGEPSKTEVAVEIHYHINSDYNKRKSSLPNKRRDSSKTSPLLGLEMGKRVRSHSHSIESNKFYDQRSGRRTKSYEDIIDYDVLKITEFRGPFYNTDFDVISELGSPTSCKVRYNDIGSIEQLNEETLDRLSLYDDFDDDSMRMDENDDTETINGTQKYRELWNLRTTFEEEEECSDTIRMEDTITSPEETDQSPEENSNSYISNSPNSPYGRIDRKRPNNGYNNGRVHVASNMLHPNYENRRQTYKNILTKRLQRAQQNTSAENSFDSVETVDDTDGDISDTSRHEVTTTSFETSTENTDSTTESQNRLIQMKADSGYKSLENQPTVAQPPGAVKRNHSTGEIEELEAEGRFCFGEAGPSGEQYYVREKSADRRSGRTASKKRREYSRERQAVQIYESINEPETDSRSDQPSGDSFEENPAPSKISVFSRLFKSQKGNKQRSNGRDYSIDEKTDKLFREFLRYDPRLDNRPNVSPHSHRSPRFHKHRLHRKHTEPLYFEERRRDRLAPEMRTASLGSDSSASSARRISPQDSIEEEDYEEVREAEQFDPSPETERDISSRHSLSIHEIPVIKLPEEEAPASF